MYYVNYDAIKRSKYMRKWKHSVGTMDNCATNVLSEINAIKNPNAEDNYVAGNIIAYNMLDGRIRNNPQIGINAINRFGNVVNQARNAEQTQIHNIPVDYMIDDITNFAVVNLEDLIVDADIFTDTIITELINILDDIPSVQQHNTENKINETIREAKNAKEFSQKYFDKSVQHTSKTQNVHDVAVVKDLNNTLRIIRESSSGKDWETVLSEVKDYVEELKKTEKISPEKYANVMRVLAGISNNSMISTYNVTEGNILKYVWDRMEDPRNRKNAEKIREAIIDEIANSVEDNEVICPGGRSARLLGSLVTLDFNPDIGAACTLEDYKNEIYQRCKELIDSCIENAKKSHNPELRKIAMSYEDPTIEIAEDRAQEFKIMIKSGMDTILSEYSGKMRDQQLEQLKKDCYAAII